MKTKRRVYCDYAFWNEFFDLENSEKICNVRKNRKAWDAFMDFLEASIIIINIEKDKIDGGTKGGKEIFDFYKRSGGASIKCDKGVWPNVSEIKGDEDEVLNSVFLLNESTEFCNKRSKTTGVLFLNIDMIFSSSHMYVDNGITFTPENGANWSYLYELKEKYPGIGICNSILVLDRYLFKNMREESIKHNLKPILDSLLPKQLGNGISLNLIIMAESAAGVHNNVRTIKGIIRELRPCLKFTLNVYLTDKIHGRSILTNNIFLTSDIGFSVIRQDVISQEEITYKDNETHLEFPFFRMGANNDLYLERINGAHKVKNCCKQDWQDVLGDRDTHNHLLDYYFEPQKSARSTFALGDTCSEQLSKLLSLNSR